MGKDQSKQKQRVSSWQASWDMHQTKMLLCVPELPRVGNPEAALSISVDRLQGWEGKAWKAGSFQGKVPKSQFLLSSYFRFHLPEAASVVITHRTH